MAKDFSRKDLKQQDEFTRSATTFAQWAMQRRKSIGLALLIVVAIVSIVMGIRSYRQGQESDAAALLAVALQVYTAPVEADGETGAAPADEHSVGGHHHYATANEKFEAAVDAFRPVVDQYGGYPSGRAAAFYLGSALAQLGRTDEAEEALRAGAEADAGLVRAMSLQRLGDLFLEQQRYDEAIAIYDRLVDSPPGGYPVEEALTSKARAHQAAGDLQAAMVAYQRIAEEHEASVYALPAQLRAEELAAQLGVELDAES